MNPHHDGGYAAYKTGGRLTQCNPGSVVGCARVCKLKNRGHSEPRTKSWETSWVIWASALPPRPNVPWAP